jgi:hypothetical protein
LRAEDKEITNGDNENKEEQENKANVIFGSTSKGEGVESRCFQTTNSRRSVSSRQPHPG